MTYKCYIQAMVTQHNSMQLNVTTKSPHWEYRIISVAMPRGRMNGQSSKVVIRCYLSYYGTSMPSTVLDTDTESDDAQRPVVFGQN